MGSTAFSISLILCSLLASISAQGLQTNSTNSTDASVCTSGKGKNRIRCDEVRLFIASEMHLTSPCRGPSAESKIKSIDIVTNKSRLIAMACR